MSADAGGPSVAAFMRSIASMKDRTYDLEVRWSSSTAPHIAILILLNTAAEPSSSMAAASQQWRNGLSAR